MSTAVIPLIGAGVGLIGSIINAASSNRNTSVGNPTQDAPQINTRTEPFWNQMQGFLGQYSPTANVGMLQGLTGGVNQITGDTISPFGASLMGTANILANQNMRNIQQQYGNQNLTNTGSFVSAASRGMAEPISQATSQIAGMQANLGGSLLQNILGQAGGAFQNAQGWLGQAAAPKWWSPTYQPTANPMGSALSFLGGALPGIGSLFNSNPNITTTVPTDSGTTTAMG